MAQEEETSCYTYQVTMIVQILAKDELTAREKLDKDGGYVTKRDVELKDSIALYSEIS
jgi:hypothetical protein